MEIMHGYSKGVIGRDMYSDNTLRHMSKSELIELLKIAQHNYEAVLEAYGNSVAYSERLLKERDNGIREFVEQHKEIMRAFLYSDSMDFLMKWCEYETNTDNLMREMVGEDDDYMQNS